MKVFTYTDPFPHWIIKDYWPEGLLDRAIESIPEPSDPKWQRFDNAEEKKLAMSNERGWSQAVRQVIREMIEPEFARSLSIITGIDDLVGRVEGGGIHRIEPGGMLQTHVDFNRGSNGMYRRLNCLLYLNRDWTEEDGGHLELRKNADDPEPAVRILPTANTMVVFKTSESSWHGHPIPLPGPRPRLSLATYFYTLKPPEDAVEPHSTIFAPSDSR